MCFKVINSLMLMHLLLIQFNYLCGQSVNTSKGIKFERFESWTDVLKRAKSLKKNIFLDIYTTWCAPCKAMDQHVFSQSNVGYIYNDLFICVKIQADKTKYDDSLVEKWYADAVMLQKEYSINAFPTYLYISSDGKPLHKAIGYHAVDSFIKLAKIATDPKMQYYSILGGFEPGKLDTGQLKGLARAFKRSGNQLAGKLAADYLTRVPKSELNSEDNLKLMSEFANNNIVLEVANKTLQEVLNKYKINIVVLELIQSIKLDSVSKKVIENYIVRLNKEDLFKRPNLELISLFKDNVTVNRIAQEFIRGLNGKKMYEKDMLQFISNFVSNSKDKYFNLFYKNGHRVDLIIGQKGYSKSVIDNVILNSDINPIITSTKDGQIPDFEEIMRIISRKYDRNYALENVLAAKVAFFKFWTGKYNTLWDKYLQCSIEQVEKYGTDTTNIFAEGNLNNIAWDIFCHSTNYNELSIAIKWMEGVIRRKITNQANSLDTYANLLYKRGDELKAMEYEERAIVLATEKNDVSQRKMYENCLEKMKEGLPTWP